VDRRDEGLAGCAAEAHVKAEDGASIGRGLAAAPGLPCGGEVGDARGWAKDTVDCSS
jgi:hypothetical protein